MAPVLVHNIIEKCLNMQQETIFCIKTLNQFSRNGYNKRSCSNIQKPNHYPAITTDQTNRKKSRKLKEGRDIKRSISLNVLNFVSYLDTTDDFEETVLYWLMKASCNVYMSHKQIKGAISFSMTTVKH